MPLSDAAGHAALPERIERCAAAAHGFQPMSDEGEEDFPDPGDDDTTPPTGTDDNKGGGDKKTGEVVSLDKFRKK